MAEYIKREAISEEIRKYYEYTNENGFCDRGERKEGAE